MKKISRVPINIKYMLPIVLLTIITISIYTLFIRISTADVFKQYLKDEIRLIINDINKTITIHMLTGHGNEFSTYLEGLYNYEIQDVISIGILDRSGRPIYLYSRNADQKISLPPMRGYLNMVTTEHKGSIEVFYPVSNQSACYRCHGAATPLLGLLYIKISTDRYNTAFRGLLSNWFTMSVIVVSILIFSIWLITTIVIEKPIEDLVGTLKKASEGNLSVRLSTHENDELGFLSEQVNMMLDRLAYKEAEAKKMTELQIQRMDKLASLGEISLSLAHEIRNPLAGISGVLQVFKDDLVTDKEKSALFNQIMQQIGKIDKLVGDMLTFSKLPVHDITEFNINESIKAIKLLLEPQAVAEHISIVLPLDIGVPDIKADKDSLEQVVINLMLNAMQAMPGGGTLEVSTEFIDTFGEPYILIKASDTGKGIPPGIRDRIFDPFFTTKHNGTGLGLAISLSIVRGMNGNITFETEEGKGTTFFVRIPYVEVT
ncbi:MAG: ATP-binding protein [Deltaproteobacteria bacterium]|nr:ATP-binding protein [Deltaproteobacteria bacterium]MCL5276257.1 ATP-binding protein [Deltaproteobacteria bacterium]